MIRLTDILAIGCIGIIWMTHSLIIPEAHTWLRTLPMPPFAPPYWLFTPVWIGIYICLSIALAYAFRVLTREHLYTIILWHVNAIAHIVWVPLFFRWHMLWASAIDVAVIAVTAAMLAFHMARHAWWAGGLIVPYAVWTIFATYINFGIAILHTG